MTPFDPSDIKDSGRFDPGIPHPFAGLPRQRLQIALSRNALPGQLEISAAQALMSWAVNRTPGRIAWSLSVSFASTAKSGIPFATAWVSLNCRFCAFQQNIQHCVRVQGIP
jgi:hypothetical protein